MSAGIWIVVAVVIVVAAVVAVVVPPALRTKRLQRNFGDEYHQAVQTRGDRRAGERELSERERRHARLDLRPLSEDSKQGFTTRWSEVELGFVDDPADAVTSADQLVSAVMAERGYPVESYEQQAADLSVRHATRMQSYRSAHAVAVRPTDTDVSTEERRTALVHYRELFHELLNGDSPTK